MRAFLDYLRSFYLHVVSCYSAGLKLFQYSAIRCSHHLHYTSHTHHYSQFTSPLPASTSFTLNIILQCKLKHWNSFHTCNWTLNIYWTDHPSHTHLATDLWSSSVGETAPYWQVKQEWHEPQSTTTQHHHNAVKQHGQISSQEHRVLTKQKHEITQWGSTAHMKYSYISERQVQIMGHLVWQIQKIENSVTLDWRLTDAR